MKTNELLKLATTGAAALVYSARADDVVTTICDGNVLMEERVLPGIDEAEIRQQFREHALALRDRSLD